MSHESAPATGGQKMIILTEKKVGKNDGVWFYEVNAENEKVWEAQGFIQSLTIHQVK